MRLHEKVTDPRTIKKFITLEQELNRKHNNKYSYEKAVYINTLTKIIIICPEHGEFEQRVGDHLQGKGCIKCAGTSRDTTETFITKAVKVHGNTYDYSKVKYVDNSTKVEIICKEHGSFKQQPNNHTFKGYGCPTCGVDRRASARKRDTEGFIAEAVKVHGDAFDYSLVDYKGKEVNVTITCKGCGSTFLQLANNHLRGKGCASCSYKTGGIKNRLSSDEFIKRSIREHGDTYDYSKVDYTISNKKVEIVCKKHGSFWQTAYLHSHGGGCPRCGTKISKAEDEINEYIKSLGVNTIQSDRKLIAPQEVDILIPSHKIAIEYNGLKWHSSEYRDKYYHRNKTLAVESKGYRLIHIFEDMWGTKKEILKSFLKRLLNKDTTKTIYARKCVLKEIKTPIARDFLNKYHIQGYGNGYVRYGMFYKGELVAVSVYAKGKKNTKNVLFDELVRHATKYPVVGSLGKILKHHMLINKRSVYTFCDLSYFNGNSYEKVGFVKEEIIPPDYKYKVGKKLEHKFLWRRKAIELKLPEFYSEDLSEREMMDNGGIYRVYDCGKVRYSLTYQA